MSNAISNVLAFTIGAAISAVATGMYFKRKYENMAREEIEEVRNYYTETKKEETENKEEKQEQEQVAVTGRKDMYDTLASMYKNDNSKKGDEPTNSPYVIEPEALGDDDRDIECLTYYADGILADSMGNVVEDVDGTVGADFFTHFGEYEDDSVHIRNDSLYTDYEILKDLRKYTEVPQFQQ